MSMMRYLKRYLVQGKEKKRKKVLRGYGIGVKVEIWDGRCRGEQGLDVARWRMWSRNDGGSKGGVRVGKREKHDGTFRSLPRYRHAREHGVCVWDFGACV